jgi:hypothetical protein
LGLPFILSICKNSAYLFKPEVGEIADQHEEIEGGQGQRHKGRVQVFTHNVVDGEKNDEKIANEEDPPDFCVKRKIVDNDHYAQDGHEEIIIPAQRGCQWDENEKNRTLKDCGFLHSFS